MAIKIFGEGPLVSCTNINTNKWMILWNPQEEKSTEGHAEVYTSYMAEVFNHKPTLEEIQDVIFGWYNKQIEEKILSGFVWRNMKVWLSMENQFNYKVAYDLAHSSNEEYLPTFKLGTTNNPIYYKFDSIKELDDFYTRAFTFINDTLAEGWRIKDSIDWSKYEELLKE